MARRALVLLIAALVASCQRPTGELPAPDGGAACGNGRLDPGEVCDDGNTTSGDGCSADCASDETCGNGVVDPGELCDDGNTIGGDTCSADCKSDETCGNGVVDTDRGETCDDGNTRDGDGCSANCQSDEMCGNGVVDPGEDCDSRNQFTPTCDPDCHTPRCGDGVINHPAGEACDDGNTSDNDNCTHKCTISRCGDGILDTQTEECDDGNTNNSDGCQNTCKLGPGNDAPAFAIDISAGGTFAVDLTHAHDDVRASCNELGGRDVFYKLTLPTDEVIYADTFTSSFDTTLAVFAGPCTARKTEETCDDDACGGGQSQIAGWLAAGTYCLVLDQNSPQNPAGPATLVFRRGGHTGDEIGLGSAAQVVMGDTTTNYDQMQGTCGDNNAAPDYGYWFTTCPGEVVDVAADTCAGAAFDTVLYVKSAADLAADVTCDDDSATCAGSTISAQISGSADLHWIIVDGQSGSGGTYTLTYTLQDD